MNLTEEQKRELIDDFMNGLTVIVAKDYYDRLEAENRELKTPICDKCGHYLVMDMNDIEYLYCPHCLADRLQKLTEQQAERIKELEGLLGIAKCPNCDGCGIIQHQVSQRQYVTRDMALDAGDITLEGSLYSDEQWETEQCQWCYERKQALKDTK